jgi:hypothetical protein
VRTWSFGHACVWIAATLCVESSRPARAAETGEVIQVENIGVPLYSHNLDAGTTTSIADHLPISEFLGAHYFVTDTLRVGLNFQFTELFAGNPPAGGDRFTTFALLPQVGWNFYRRLFVAGVFSYAPRADGQTRLDLGVQAVFGGSIPLTPYASVGLAIEVPYNFHIAATIGITPLAGLTYRL